VKHIVSVRREMVLAFLAEAGMADGRDLAWMIACLCSTKRKMKFPKWYNLAGLLTFVHTIVTVATTTTSTTDTLLPRSYPASVRLIPPPTRPPPPSLPSTPARTNNPLQLPICTGPWPPIAPPNHLFFPLLNANIDFRTFPTLVAFCTAPQPANCHCALDDRTRRFEVDCEHNAVPLAHMWGFLYAIHYCERWCRCANPEELQGLRIGGREG